MLINAALGHVPENMVFLLLRLDLSSIFWYHKYTKLGIRGLKMKPAAKKIQFKVVNKPAHTRASSDAKADTIKTCSPRTEA